MPKLSIYVPDRLYDAVRKHDVPISAVTQRALEEAVRHRTNTDWAARARSRKPRTKHTIDTGALVNDVRSEFGS